MDVDKQITDVRSRLSDHISEKELDQFERNIEKTVTDIIDGHSIDIDESDKVIRVFIASYYYDIENMSSELDVPEVEMFRRYNKDFNSKKSSTAKNAVSVIIGTSYSLCRNGTFDVSQSVLRDIVTISGTLMQENR